MKLTQNQNDMKPVRIQRKRTKGWKMPENTVCVTRPGKWGNPYHTTLIHDAKWIVEKFELQLITILKSTPNYLDELKGKNLACWCKIGEPCHADVFLKYANQ